ncbi:MAG: ABC transporter permease [Rubrivivax sp.]|nr:ABC transporter permease [Rubrivivax sp.]
MVSTLARTQSVGRAAARWGQTWWRILHLGSLLGALALSPSSWRQPWRAAIAARVWRSSAPLLPGFSLLITLVSLVIMRIVLVTALSYGLSQYALQMVVRVLVLELIPLTAALFVALRVSLPSSVELAELRSRDSLSALRQAGRDVLRMEILPRAVGSFFAVLLLAALSGVICLVLAYLVVHGFSPWGLERYTRTVGQVFSPSVSLIFVLKALAMALAVSIIPIGSALHDRAAPPRGDAPALSSGIELQGLVRMFAALLLIEMLSLMGNYI